MIDRPIDEETVAAVNKRRLLWGFLPFEDALASLRKAQSMLDPLDQNQPDVEELRSDWRSAKESITPLDEPPESPEILDIPEDPEIEHHLDELTSMAFFRNSYGDVGWRFKLVPINKLISIQAAVTTTAHQDVQSKIGDELDIFQYVFPTEREQPFFTQSIQTSNNELIGVQLTSRAPNVSVSEMRVLEGERPMEKNVLFSIRAPPNLVNCALVDDRLYLINGYHRTYQLYLAGETHVPAIIREPEEFAADAWEFNEEIILADRPPVITDFETDAATTFHLPATNELIRITAESTKVFR